MLKRFQGYLSKLEALPPEALDRSAEALVLKEKQNVARLIAHLAEMSRRKVALELGYKHLFDYCDRRLRLSEGSVALRLQVANAARRFPQLLVALAENRLSLTVAGLLAPHLTEANVEKLIATCEGMTKREAEEHLVALRPRPVFNPSIRRQPQRPVPPPVTRPIPLEPKAEVPRPRPKPILQPAEPETFNFRFSAGREFKDKLERLAEVMGVENAERRMAELLEQAIDMALDKKDPKKKMERREAKAKAKAKPGSRSPRPDEVAPKASRYVSSEVTERVFARAGYQCEYRSRDGTRCRSRTGLQIEHTRPFALHKSHDERFLRAYCAAHNRLAAERVYGGAFIEGKIAASRQRAP